MPLYEYTCRDCGRRFDALRSMQTADDPIACIACHGTNTTRNLSVFFSRSAGARESEQVAPSSSGCAGCGGGSCSACRY